MDGLSVGDPLVLGRFRLVGRLGSGGMGRVCMRRSPAGEMVAVKTMHPRIAEDPEFWRRFASEVAILRRIASPSSGRIPCRGTPRWAGPHPPPSFSWSRASFALRGCRRRRSPQRPR
jgi:serine/threonine protein kinase